MKISLFGLGYVGCVTAACLAERGHRIVGVDVNPDKVDLINDGLPTVIEKDLAEIVKRHVAAGDISATGLAADAVRETDVSMICVGTPSRPNGGLNDEYVKRVAAQIGEAVRDKDGDHIVIVRSTVLPGTTERTVLPILESTSGRRMGAGIGLAFNPEFLREGTAVEDFYNPPKTVIGGTSPEVAECVAELYAELPGPLHITTVGVAELVKYADNAFHGLKIAFANEIGSVAGTLGLDGQEVMSIFCTDEKLNISTAYFKPGNPFGGSCLPKDLRALSYFGRSRDLELPLMRGILDSNEEHWRRGLNLVLSDRPRPIGVLGLSFKEGTDDLRESHIVRIIEHLLGKGYPVKIHDANVNVARLTGTNRAYLETQIPHITALMADTVEEVLEFGEILVVGNATPSFREALAPALGKKRVVDLVRLFPTPPAVENYLGVTW